MPQVPVNFLILYLKIRHCRLTRRTPVHHVAAAIDQPFLVQLIERSEYSLAQPFVHREALAAPISGDA